MIPQSFLEKFQNDKSLEQAQLERQPRPMTAEFKPKNLKQSLDFIRWKESTRWAQAKTKEGYYYGLCDSHGIHSGMMFYTKNEVDLVNWHMHHTRTTPAPERPKDWVCAAEANMRYPEMGIPQIWSARKDLMVSAKDAKAILVDFIGLDEKILGLETRHSRAR